MKNIEKLIGELREKVKELEEKNKHLSNVSDYETISLECIRLEEQLEIEKSRIQELEEENAILKKASNIAKNINIDDVTKVINKSYDEFMSNYISKQVVKEVLQNNRNELFGMTCLTKKQYKPYEMQIERINKIEQELLEGESK